MRNEKTIALAIFEEKIEVLFGFQFQNEGKRVTRKMKREL